MTLLLPVVAVNTEKKKTKHPFLALQMHFRLAFACFFFPFNSIRTILCLCAPRFARIFSMAPIYLFVYRGLLHKSGGSCVGSWASVAPNGALSKTRELLSRLEKRKKGTEETIVDIIEPKTSRLSRARTDAHTWSNVYAHTVPYT